ncbi:LADA_0D07404g1_1 [Lachancea dasiensis]|uniref:LADA_0D07404g1_1 n=1 Tax=Lachancea dasiensis TaxID=1072105 RepID=A0A1G4J6H3_9SACH|nr:LADA_0D07404g1_1 [Lachancea dasiensis]
MSGSLLRKITRQISPHHNPEGITFGKTKLLFDRKAPDSKPAQETYASTLVSKLADGLKYEVEHVERSVVPVSVLQHEQKPAKKKNEPTKPRSKARLTGERVAELVEAAAAAPEGMYW